jgi:hypothetical protein
MRVLAAVTAAALLSACSHVEINAGANTSGSGAAPVSGTSVTSGSAGLQARSDSRGLVTAIVVMGLIAGAIEYSREPRPFPSPSDLLPENTPPAPALAPERKVNEQDCSKPIDWSLGNLRCK